MANTFMLLLVLIPALIIWGVIIYVVYLLIVALRKYIKSEPVRKEKEEYAKTLGGVIKKHRMECQMTQEFVAEHLVYLDKQSLNGKMVHLIQVRLIL